MEEKIETVVAEEPANKEKVEEKKASKQSPQKKDNKKKKDKQPSKAGRRIKETASELKKVTWPTFPDVVKKTCVVLAVVLIFAVVLFGIDRLLAWVFDLLTNTMA